jgi:hypothetical protein
MARVAILLSARLFRQALEQEDMEMGLQEPVERKLKMPPFDHPFWDERANRLRVFATDGGFLHCERVD